MISRCLLLTASLVLVGGCSASNGLSTGSLFGGSSKPVTATAGGTTAATSSPAAPVVSNDPMNRALHVGANSARAIRCGFHFDASKLKADYMAHETAAGHSVETLSNIGKAYSTGFNGVSKGIQDSKTYCTPRRVDAVKAALTRYLAGDYTPPPPSKVAKAQDPGFFGGLFNSDDADNSGPKFGSQEWWDKQNDASGN